MHVLNRSMPRPLWVVFTVFALFLFSSACDSNKAGNENADGNCRITKNNNDTDIRLHFLNAENIANVQLLITTPAGSCSIDKLPVETNQGIELGQAVFALNIGDTIGLNAQSPSGGVSGQCKVNADALTHQSQGTSNSIFIDVYVTSGIIACNDGVDPA